MNLITISVCVDYYDLLSITYKKNKKYFNDKNHYHIITSTNDQNTQNFCKLNNITCFITDSFYQNKSCFNKGAAMNAFMRNLNENTKEINWILNLDSDIILNNSLENFMNHMDNNSMYDQSKLYSCKRRIFRTQKDYVNNIYYIEKNCFFIGYFQLFHFSKLKPYFENKKSSKKIFYEHKNASKYDSKFRDQYWSVRHRKIIDGIVDHLGPTDTNWNGRKTELWNNT